MFHTLTQHVRLVVLVTMQQMKVKLNVTHACLEHTNQTLVKIVVSHAPLVELQRALVWILVMVAHLVCTVDGLLQSVWIVRVVSTVLEILITSHVLMVHTVKNRLQPVCPVVLVICLALHTGGRRNLMDMSTA